MEVFGVSRNNWRASKEPTVSRKSGILGSGIKKVVEIMLKCVLLGLSGSFLVVFCFVFNVHILKNDQIF